VSFIKKGYIVHGLKDVLCSIQIRIDHLYQDPIWITVILLHYGDMMIGTNLTRLIQEIQPDEIYNLAAMSHVAVSLKHLNIQVMLMDWELYVF
jgi:GDPmannose 4,6-dehydratase